MRLAPALLCLAVLALDAEARLHACQRTRLQFLGAGKFLRSWADRLDRLDRPRPADSLPTIPMQIVAVPLDPEDVPGPGLERRTPAEEPAFGFETAEKPRAGAAPGPAEFLVVDGQDGALGELS